MARPRLGLCLPVVLLVVPVGVLGLCAWLQGDLASWVKLAELASILFFLALILIWRKARLLDNHMLWIAISVGAAAAGWLGWVRLNSARCGDADGSDAVAGRSGAPDAAHLQAMTALMALAGNLALGLGALVGLAIAKAKEARITAEAGKAEPDAAQGGDEYRDNDSGREQSFKPDADRAKPFKLLAEQIKLRIELGSEAPEDIGDNLGDMLKYFETIDADKWDDRRATMANRSVSALEALIGHSGIIEPKK